MWVNYNGRFYPALAVPVAANDLAWQYGFSLFETMRWTGEGLPLFEKHFQRLTAGLKMLQISQPAFLTPHFIQKEIQSTIKKNGISTHARVRLQVSPVFTTEIPEKYFTGIHYKIECYPCEKAFFNKVGIIVGIAETNLSPLSYSGFKTGNYLPYFLASLDAKRLGFDDNLLLNSNKRIGEASTSNVFWTQNGQIYTPPLSEGIVAGVGRSRLIAVLSQEQKIVQEQPLTLERLRQADAVYLTNAFQGLRWVKNCEGLIYKPDEAEALFQKAFDILTY